MAVPLRVETNKHLLFGPSHINPSMDDIIKRYNLGPDGTRTQAEATQK
jgi:hypothetical protein